MEIEDMNLSTSRKPLANNKGFTLIELAMVMIIVGLLLSIGMSLVGPLTKRAKLTEARDAVKAAKEALLGYAVKIGNLPTTIGLSGGRELDAWGRNIQYTVEAALNGTGNACRQDTTNIKVFECTNPTCSAYRTKDNIAFIAYSNGEDADGAGTTTRPTAGPVCPVTVPPTTCFWIREQGSSDASYALQYDDIVQYVALDEIRSSMGCSQPLVVTSPSRLPQGEEDNFYSYSMQAIGGKPPYSWGDGSLWNASGLSLNTSGLISGTLNFSGGNPGELANCREVITVAPSELQVTDSLGAIAFPSLPFANYSIPVRPKALSITTTDLPSTTVGTVNAAYATLSGTGGVRSGYSWQLNGVPTGLIGTPDAMTGDYNLSINNPPTPGTFSFTATLTDGCGGSTASKRFSITVNPREGYYCTISATPATLNSGNFTNINYAVYNYQTSPPNVTLAFSSSPAGLTGTCTGGSVVANTSPYVGSCQSAALPSSTSFTLTFTDAAGKQASCSTTAFVGPSTTAPPSCTVQVSPNPVTSGQTTTLSWNIMNGPANITCTSSPTAGLCPAADCNPAGSYGGNCTTSAVTGNTTFQLTAANSNGNGLCATTVYLSSLSCPALFNTTPNPLSAGYQTVPYSRNITYTGGFAPVTCSISAGSLPPGLSLAGCTISGTPTSTGTYNFTTRVGDSCGIQQTKDQATSIRTFGSIVLRNTTGGARRYKRNGGACTAWNNNTDITVLPADTYQIATTALNCTANTFCATTNFAGQYPLDADADGLTRMNNPCVFADR